MSIVKQINKILEAWYKGDSDQQKKRPYQNIFKNKEQRKAYHNGYNK